MGNWHMEAVYEQIEELQTAAELANSEPIGALFADSADMALWLLARAERAEAEVARLREALTKISSPTQTERLLWWQIEARAALQPAEDT